MAFIKNIVSTAPYKLGILLFLAWLGWGLSLAFILSSFYLSRYSLRHAIKQTDEETIYTEKPGGRYAVVTETLNIAGGIAFLIGIILMIIFAYNNMRI